MKVLCTFFSKIFDLKFNLQSLHSEEILSLFAVSKENINFITFKIELFQFLDETTNQP